MTILAIALFTKWTIISTPNPDPYLSLELDVYKELLRQARQTFNVHIAAIVAAFFFSLGGLSLAFTGKVTEGTITGVTGTGAAAYFIKLAKEASNESSKKLEKVTREIKTLRRPPDE